MFGAEIGPKVDPTTTTYVPRPDWYFFFLFEVLRVMKNIPKFTDLATIGVPTICMILLFLLPFYDRSPERRIERRPVALAAGLTTIFAMAFLTYSGANTGSPNSVDLAPPASLTASQKATFRAGEEVVGQSGCLACHVIGDNGNNGPGPPLTHIGSILRPQAIASTLRNPDRADAVVRRPGQDQSGEVQQPGQLPLDAPVGRSGARDHDGELIFAAGPLRHGRL